MPQGQNLDGIFPFDAIVQMVTNSEEVQPLYPWKRYVQRLRTYTWLRGDELEAAGQLLAEQIACCGAVLIPPASRLSNLPLGIGYHQQPKRQAQSRISSRSCQPSTTSLRSA